MKNIYFIQANDVYDGAKRQAVYMPYSVGCVIAYCRHNEIIASNYRFGRIIYRREPVAQLVASLDNPYMLLFSCSSWNAEYNKAVAVAVKKKFPDCLITFGGHNITPDGEYLKKYDFIDFLTHRAGEEPTEGILENLALEKDISDVPNISYRTAAGEVVTTACVLQTGIDYPSPYLDGVFDEIMQDDIDFSAIFETNRGCPNSCAFCDWGSLKAKVRLRPMDKVLAEIDWFAEHKIEYVFCADANFCLFSRDKEIAEYMINSKKTRGYPKVLHSNYTKNKFDFVFDVGAMLVRNGLEKAQTISFQSMNPTVLENIGRWNIPAEHFRDLMRRYNDIGIPTLTELIVGLPGETYESFCEGMCSMMENGQHHSIMVYTCVLLPNSRLGQKSVREQFKIQSVVCPIRTVHASGERPKDDIVEYAEYITGTYSMNQEQWKRALFFARFVQGLHNFGLLRAIAIYYRYEYQYSYVDFYNDLIDAAQKPENEALHYVYAKISGLCDGILSGANEFCSTCDGAGDILWDFEELIFLEYYKKYEMLLAEVKALLIARFGVTDEAEAIFRYQYDITKKIGVTDIEIRSDYDFYSYFNRVYRNDYDKPEKKKIVIRVHDQQVVNSLPEFAREIAWYGRNRRESDYTSSYYDVRVSAPEEA